MVQVQKWMTYGFVPWTIMFGSQETGDASQADSPPGAVPRLQDEQQVSPPAAAPREGAPLAGSAPGPLTQVKFRRALIEVDDPTEFWSGVVGGQVAALEEESPLTGGQIFALFEDAVRDVEFSETWLDGYVLGLGDALLRKRKMYPRAYTARLQFLRARKRRQEES